MSIHDLPYLLSKMVGEDGEPIRGELKISGTVIKHDVEKRLISVSSQGIIKVFEIRADELELYRKPWEKGKPVWLVYGVGENIKRIEPM